MSRAPCSAHRRPGFDPWHHIMVPEHCQAPFLSTEPGAALSSAVHDPAPPSKHKTAFHKSGTHRPQEDDPAQLLAIPTSFEKMG